MAYKSKGVLLQINTGSGATTIANRTTVTWSGAETRTAETTNLDSVAAEYVPTIVDFGELSCEFQYDPNNSTHKALWDLLDSPEVVEVSMVMPGDTSVTITADTILTNFETDAPSQDDVMTGSATFKITGKPSKS